VCSTLLQDITTQSGLKIHKLASGSGQSCAVGDLAAIRFKGRYKDYVFDDIFGTPEPLYFRAGGGNLVKGIDEAIVMMKIGDRWELTIPGPLAFGDKGRSPSPGKPR
jgi:FKBP-type peptidyl-prolyl cis-trans isomerase